MLVVNKPFNIAANDVDAQKSAHCSRVLAVTELVASGTQCTSSKCTIPILFFQLLLLTRLPLCS